MNEKEIIYKAVGKIGLDFLRSKGAPRKLGIINIDKSEGTEHKCHFMITCFNPCGSEIYEINCFFREGIEPVILECWKKGKGDYQVDLVTGEIKPIYYNSNYDFSEMDRDTYDLLANKRMKYGEITDGMREKYGVEPMMGFGMG